MKKSVGREFANNQAPLIVRVIFQNPAGPKKHRFELNLIETFFDHMSHRVNSDSIFCRANITTNRRQEFLVGFTRHGLMLQFLIPKFKKDLESKNVAAIRRVPASRMPDKRPVASGLRFAEMVAFL